MGVPHLIIRESKKQNLCAVNIMFGKIYIYMESKYTCDKGITIIKKECTCEEGMAIGKKESK